MVIEDNVEQLTPIKRALLEIRELRTRLQQAESRHREPIAVIGMGLRFPGGVHDLSSFWQVLAEGKDAIGDIPPDRWDRDAYFDSDPLQPGKMNVRQGGFIDGVDLFDAEFFGISPREAASMDPQHRLLLEVCWEALEHAGECPARLAESQTAVFIGIANGDYFRMLYSDPAQIDPYAASGNGFSLASGRLSYLLGVHGPSVTIDTACSSSLVALHLACQSLRLGECSMALAGGVNLILSPELNINLAKVRVLAPDGRCKSFSAAADGYGRSEGCGIAVLKPLSAALADRNRILAVIRGSAVNQDGRSAGITAPNGPAQEAVIRAALKDAGVSPEEITYVEAHGTGTALGDPIEVQALAAALGQGRSPGHPLLVGAVKANIGHLEAAAGMTGLAKAILVHQHQAIPPTIHLHEKNPAVDWKSLPLSIPTELTPWPDNAPQMIGLSSFGMSGTNAHVVLEAAPIQAKTKNDPERPLHLLALSAVSQPALAQLASSYERFLAETDAEIADVCFTANAGRSAFPHRLAVTGASAAEIRTSLAGWIAQPQSEAATSRPKIAFVYTGQGAQYAGMGAELYRTSPTFRVAIDQCEELLRPCMDRKLTEILFPAPGDESLINQTLYLQPAMFALQYALTELWRSWGLEPALVAGHSLGEYAAACAAGIFSVSDGLQFVAARARLTASLPPDGGMMAVFASQEQVLSVIAPYADRISIGALNGPKNVVVSGGLRELDVLAGQFEAAGIKCHRLKVPTAYHSPLLDPILDEFEAVAQTVSYASPKVGFISNVSGAAIDADKPLTASYWRQHLRQSVRFSAGLEALYHQGVRHFLELGPKPVLCALGMESHATECKWYASLAPQKTEWSRMLETLRSLYLEGASVDWAGFDRDYLRNRVTAPTYPFQRKSYWKAISRPSAPATAAMRSTVAPEVPGGDWTYSVTFEPLAESSGESQSGNGPRRWLILADRQGIGEGLAHALQLAGESVKIFHRTGDDAGEVADFLKPENLAVTVSPWNGGSEIATEVVHLWGLDRQLSEDAKACDVEDALTAGPESTLLCMQLLAQFEGLSPRLWIVTRGAQRISSQDLVDPAQAATWGLARSFAAEHPLSWGGIVDLSPAATAVDVSPHLAEALRTPCGEDQLALRDGRRFGARLVPEQLRPERRFAWRSDATYLITGGLGGLGLALAAWLVQHGARNLALLGRTPLPPREQWHELGDNSRQARRVQQIRHLESMGARVFAGRADVGDQESLTACLRDLEQSGLPPIGGLIHAAGVMSYQSVREATLANFRETLHAKAIGAWLLHNATLERNLDCFFMFSSAAALLDIPFVGAYAAASAFLDGLADRRGEQGLASTSVNWGLWRGIGMGEDVSDRELAILKARGTDSIPVDTGIELLGHIVQRKSCHVAVMPMDWQKWKSAFWVVAGHPFFSRLIGGTSGNQAAPRVDQRKAIAAATGPERALLLRQCTRRHVAEVLGLSESALDEGTSITRLGLDSLMATELRSRLLADTGCSLPLTELLDGPSATELAVHLESVLGSGAAAERQDLLVKQELVVRQELFVKQELLVKMNPGAPGRLPLFFVQASDGTATDIRPLMTALDPDLPFYCLLGRGWDGSEPFGTVEEAATFYVGEIRKIQPHGPYYLGGYCFGGVVAFEMARKLEESGEPTETLFIVDGYNPTFVKHALSAELLLRLTHFGIRRSTLHIREIRSLSPRKWPAYFVARGKAFWKQCLRVVGVQAMRRSAGIESGPPDIPSPNEDLLERMKQAGPRAFRKFHAKPYGGGAILVRPSERTHDPYEDIYLGWRPVIQGKIQSIEVDAEHWNILAPAFHVIARKMNDKLAESRLAIVESRSTSVAATSEEHSEQPVA